MLVAAAPASRLAQELPSPTCAAQDCRPSSLISSAIRQHEARCSPVRSPWSPRRWIRRSGVPQLPTIQEAVRANSQFETLVLLASIGASGLILLGGAVGDSMRARRVILGGLVVELLASFVSLIVPAGPIFVTSRLVGHAGAAFVIPVSIALVATSYRGSVRATAIGVAYGAYGAGGAAASILLRAVPGEQWPAMLAAIVVCALALRLAWTRTLELHRPSQAERPLVVGVALWAFGIITFTVGLTWIGGSLDNPLRWALIIGGPALVMGHHRLDGSRTASLARLVRRRVAVALFVGVTIAISETAAVLNLPPLLPSRAPLRAVAGGGRHRPARGRAACWPVPSPASS